MAIEVDAGDGPGEDELVFVNRYHTFPLRMLHHALGSRLYEAAVHQPKAEVRALFAKGVPIGRD